MGSPGLNTNPTSSRGSSVYYSNPTVGHGGGGVCFFRGVGMILTGDAVVGTEVIGTCVGEATGNVVVGGAVGALVGIMVVGISDGLSVGATVGASVGKSVGK
eukprot:scaffold35255_cov199-Amphora_coffeaeformis.AAC.1